MTLETAMKLTADEVVAMTFEQLQEAKRLLDAELDAARHSRDGNRQAAICTFQLSMVNEMLQEISHG